MESLLAPLVIGTGVFFAIRFHQQDKGWGWGLLYGLFLWPIALVHVLVIAMTAFFNGGGFARFARDAGSYAKSGAEHMRNGRYNEAIKDFGRAIELDPHPYVYEARGETYALQSKYDKAIPDFNRAIEIIDTQGFFPLQDAPYYQRGIAWAEFNEYHKAIEDFNRAIVLNPTSECYLFRGHIYAELENYDKALKDYEEAVSLNPNADTYKYRGIAYLKIGEHEKALNDFRIATSLNQEDPQAHLNAAQAYFEKNDLKSANEAFTQSMSLLPDYLRANSDFFKQEEQLEIYDLALGSVDN